MALEEFHYRVRWRPRGNRPGFHSGRPQGAGHEFRGLAPLVAVGDPRRLDLRASARDPYGQLLVRLYTQRSAVPVFALADLSGSSGFRGVTRKLELLADFAAALGYSAFRTGDPAAFIGCDDEVRADLSCALGRARAAGTEIAQRLRAFEPRSAGSQGLLAAAEQLPPARALVFLVSDFYFHFTLLDAILGALAHHQTVPIILRDSAERALPASGLLRVRDVESGRERSVVARKALRTRLLDRARAHDEALAQHFAAIGASAITLVDRFDAALVTQHFYG